MKTDALKRLEGWLEKGTRFSRYAKFIRATEGVVVILEYGTRHVTGRGKTLPAAIHAALDQAEGRR